MLLAYSIDTKLELTCWLLRRFCPVIPLRVEKEVLNLIYHFRCRWCFFKEVPRSPQSPNESFDPTPITLRGKPPPSWGCI